MVARDDLVKFLDRTFSFYGGRDDSANGLQYEGKKEVKKAAFAVDACVAAFDAAASEGADFLFVHHGLFWRTRLPERLAGSWKKRVKALAENDLSLYAMHLPLDAHPRLGNNAELARLMGLRQLKKCGEYHGERIALKGALGHGIKLKDLAGIVENKLAAKARLFDFGPSEVKRVGCCSGGGAFAVAEGGIDCLVTGEMKHSDFHFADEAGVSVIEAGHYATETLGVKAVRKEVAKRFKIETVFLDLPTGI